MKIEKYWNCNNWDITNYCLQQLEHHAFNYPTEGLYSTLSLGSPACLGAQTTDIL
jgi:hypothetical protein